MLTLASNRHALRQCKHPPASIDTLDYYPHVNSHSLIILHKPSPTPQIYTQLPNCVPHSHWFILWWLHAGCMSVMVISEIAALYNCTLVNLYLRLLAASVLGPTESWTLVKGGGGWCKSSANGQGILTLTQYTYIYMYLPFKVLFCKIWYSDHIWVFIRDEGAQIT